MTQDDVQATLAALVAARDGIWDQMPAEVVRLGQGIQPRGTGSFGQYFTPLMFAEGELRAAGDEVLWNLREVAVDPGTDLTTVRKLVHLMMDQKAHFVDFVGLPEAGALFLRLVGAVDAAVDRPMVVALLDAAMGYANRLHMWVDFVFPWGIANAFPRPEMHPAGAGRAAS